MEKTPKERMLAITEETVKFYSTWPEAQGIENGLCSYYLIDKKTGEEKMCAVGRYMKDAEPYKDVLASAKDVVPDAEMKPGAENLPWEFWEQLQSLHDRTDWNAVKFRGTIGGNVYYADLLKVIERLEKKGVNEEVN